MWDDSMAMEMDKIELMVVRLIRIEILSATLSYISRAWLEVDLSLWIPHSISLLIIVHVATIPVS